MILKEPGALSGPRGAIYPSAKVRERIPLDRWEQVSQVPEE